MLCAFVITGKMDPQSARRLPFHFSAKNIPSDGAKVGTGTKPGAVSPLAWLYMPALPFRIGRQNLKKKAAKTPDFL